MVRRTGDQSVIHYRGQGSCRLIFCQPNVNVHRNVLWLPHLVRRNNDHAFYFCVNTLHFPTDSKASGIRVHPGCALIGRNEFPTLKPMREFIAYRRLA